MDAKKLLNEFKNMNLPKQSIIAVCTITLIVLLLSNYKNMKETSIKFVDSFTNDESIKEFMVDVEKLVRKCATAIRGVMGLGEENESTESERQQLND